MVYNVPTLTSAHETHVTPMPPAPTTLDLTNVTVTTDSLVS